MSSKLQPLLVAKMYLTRVSPQVQEAPSPTSNPSVASYLTVPPGGTGRLHPHRTHEHHVARPIS
jgi:hypothetical protein